MLSERRISEVSLSTLVGDLTGWKGLRYGALAEQVRAMIVNGRIVPGTRLPSERALSEALGVSRTTVTSAYHRLRDSGYLSTVTGSGSVVTLPPNGAEPELQLGGLPAPLWPGGDREYDLTLAALPAPEGVLEAATASALAELPAHLYGNGYEPRGIAELRELIAERFERRGAPTTPDQILVTSGALHGIDLLVRALLGPGERVLMALPNYPGALDVVRGSLGRVLPVPLDESGSIDLAHSVVATRQGAPKLAYLIPDFHNPTGALMGDREREAILAAAAANSTIVVVDETFEGLGFASEGTACAAIDPDVITVGSLSKSVWGGLRVGWIRGSSMQIDMLTALRGSTDLGGPVLEQLIAVEILPQLDAILAGRSRSLSANAQALMELLRTYLPQWSFREPDGGLSLWVQLDRPGAAALTLAAMQEGIRLVAGSRFGLDGTLDRYLRIPFTLPAPELRRVVTRIARIWRELEGQLPATVELPGIVA